MDRTLTWSGAITVLNIPSLGRECRFSGCTRHTITSEIPLRVMKNCWLWAAADHRAADKRLFLKHDFVWQLHFPNTEKVEERLPERQATPPTWRVLCFRREGGCVFHYTALPDIQISIKLFTINHHCNQFVLRVTTYSHRLFSGSAPFAF